MEDPSDGEYVLLSEDGYTSGFVTGQISPCESLFDSFFLINLLLTAQGMKMMTKRQICLMLLSTPWLFCDRWKELTMPQAPSPIRY